MTIGKPLPRAGTAAYGPGERSRRYLGRESGLPGYVRPSIQAIADALLANSPILGLRTRRLVLDIVEVSGWNKWTALKAVGLARRRLREMGT